MRALVVLLIFTNTPVSAQQLNIPKELRCRNETGIQCVWVSLETLAKYHGIPEASDLGRWNRGYSTPGLTQQVLNSRGVRYVMHLPGKRNLKKLREYCEQGWGAAIGVAGGRHMVTCVGYKDGKIYFIDNSDPTLSLRYYTEEEFLQTWTGWMVTLIPAMREPNARERQTERKRSSEQYHTLP